MWLVRLSEVICSNLSALQKEGLDGIDVRESSGVEQQLLFTFIIGMTYSTLHGEAVRAVITRWKDSDRTSSLFGRASFRHSNTRQSRLLYFPSHAATCLHWANLVRLTCIKKCLCYSF